MDCQRCLCSLDDNLDLSGLTGQRRKDVAQRAFAYWIGNHAVVSSNSKAEAMKLARSIVRELGFEVESFINELKFEEVEQ